MRGDLRLVPMSENTVRLQAHFAKLVVILALRPAPLTPLVALITGHWSRFSSCFSINGFSASCRRRVTARHGNQLRLFDLVALPLRRAVYRLLQQGAMLMCETVVLAIKPASCTRKAPDRSNTTQPAAGKPVRYRG